MANYIVTMDLNYYMDIVVSRHTSFRNAQRKWAALRKKSARQPLLKYRIYKRVC